MQVRDCFAGALHPDERSGRERWCRGGDDADGAARSLLPDGRALSLRRRRHGLEGGGTVSVQYMLTS